MCLVAEYRKFRCGRIGVEPGRFAAQQAQRLPRSPAADGDRLGPIALAQGGVRLLLFKMRRNIAGGRCGRWQAVS